MTLSDFMGQWLPYAGVALPLVVLIFFMWRWNKRFKTVQREACLREIETAGGFEAWKRLYFR